MPSIVMITTPAEVFEGARAEARRLADEILRLSDVTVAPFEPGEGEQTRYHRIAKLGKKLAETFKALDDFVQMMDDAHAQHAPQHQAPPSSDKPDDTKAN